MRNYDFAQGVVISDTICGNLKPSNEDLKRFGKNRIDRIPYKTYKSRDGKMDASKG